MVKISVPTFLKPHTVLDTQKMRHRLSAWKEISLYIPNVKAAYPMPGKLTVLNFALSLRQSPYNTHYYTSIRKGLSSIHRSYDQQPKVPKYFQEYVPSVSHHMKQPLAAHRYHHQFALQ